jgi:predicted nucleic acid-binding protein
MREYFVDTWFFVALFDPADAHHAVARRIDRRLTGVPLVTHDGIFTEMLTMFADEGETVRRGAAQLVRRWMVRCVALPSDRQSFLAALRMYEDRPDKQYSLTDCMSMVMMRRRAITHVLTNDHHFAQDGFVLVNA